LIVRPRHAPSLAARSLTAVRAAACLALALSPPDARAETRLFITNHVHSDQVGGLTAWQGKVVAATLGGLVLVDPATQVRTKLLASPGGLPSNRVLAVAVGPSGILWAGTADKGVARLVPGGGFKRTLTSFDGLPSDRVQSLYVHGDSVWVGTSGGVALFTENPASGQVALRRSDNEASTGGALVSDDVLAFARVGDTLWVATSAGLSTFVNGAWADRSALINVAVRSLAVHQDTLWAATAAGPRRYQGGAFALVAGGHAGASLALHVHGGELVSGTAGQEVLRYTGTGWAPIATLPAGFRANTLETGSDGSLWAGSDRGLARYDETANTWISVRSKGPAVNGSEDAVADARGAWFAVGNAVPTGGQLGTILHYDGREWTVVSSATTGGLLQNTSVFALHSDPAAKLWLGHCCRSEEPRPRTERWDPATDVWEVLAATNLIVLEAGPGGLVYGGSVEHGNGVYLFDQATGAVVDSLTPANTQGGFGLGLASNNLRGIAFDELGRGWFAHAFQGLDLWDGKGTLAHNDDAWIHRATGLPSLQTTAVVTTSGSQGWLGTTSGLTRIRVNGAIDVDATASVNDDLPSLQVQALATDPNGNLWVGTIAGLSRVDAATLAVETWSTDDGLAGDDVRALAWDAARGVLWVGTTEGFSEVVPGGGSGTAFDESSYLYPSPLGPSATALRLGGITGVVKGEVRDASGAIVRRFEADPAQNEVWDLKASDGSRAASGVYVVVLREGDRSRALRVAVIR
jgi:ligand-binding sensor domain-containing protein